MLIVPPSDDAYTLWVNGKWIGDNIRKGGDPGGSAFRELDIYSIPLNPSNNVIAVNATNVVNVDGLISTAVVQYADGSQTVFTTDASWVSAGSAAPPRGFQEVGFNDRSWSAAAMLGGIDTAPWAPLRFGPVPAKGHCAGKKHPHVIFPPPPPIENCPSLPPLVLPPGKRSPYWEIRHTIDCEIRRLEEALWLCQKEKQTVIDQLVIIIQQIGQFGGGGGGQFCQLLNCEHGGAGGIAGGIGGILREQTGEQTD